jgi:hypothetical protein
MALITQVLHAPENIFYQAISRFQGSWLAPTSALVDSGLVYGQTVSPHMSSHTSSISLFSSIVNTGWITWDVFTLSSAFETKEVSLLSALLSSNSMPLVRMTHIAGAIFSMGAALTAVRSIYQWASSPKKVPQNWLDNIAKEDQQSVSLKFEYPWTKSYSQAIYLTRIIMNVAIACLSPERALFCGINAAGLAYGLLKNTQVKWLNFTRLFKFPKPTINALFKAPPYHQDQVECKELTFSYIFPLLPNPIAGSVCVVCQDENPTTGFSPASPSHPNCLVCYIYKNSKSIGTHIINPRYTQHIQPGKAYYSVELKIPESDLPSCPVGKNHPASHYVKAEFTDWTKGQFATTVNVIPDTSIASLPPLLSESFLARLGAVYSAFQAGLTALLHRHHELAGKIIAAQKVLCLFDIGLLVQNYYQLYRTLYEQTVPKLVHLNTSQQPLNDAQARYSAAELKESFLRDKIEEAIQAENITQQSVFHSTSAPTEKLLNIFHSTCATLAGLHSRIEGAIAEKSILETETSLSSTSEATEKLLEEFEAVETTVNRLNDQIQAAIAEGTITEETSQGSIDLEAKKLLEDHGLALKELQAASDQKNAALNAFTAARVSLEEQYRYSLYLKMGLGIAAVTAVSAISVSLLNGLLIPFNMTELLKKVFTSADFSNMKISLSMPWLSYITECILASRLVANFALAYFSPALRRTYLSTALLQTFTLVKLAQLPWIKIERTFIYPNGPMWKKGQDGAQENIKSLHSTFELLLPNFSTLSQSTYASATSHFEASIKAAYDYTTQLFKDSSWRRFILTKKTNGIVTNRSGEYIMKAKQSLLTEGAGKLTPFFNQATIWAQDLVYGKSPVLIE